MKSFLEEYGFAILAAIVVILLIAICTPLGNSVKSYIMDLVGSFASVAGNKIDAVDGENSVHIYYAENAVTGVVTSDSATDQFKYYVTYTSQGRLIKDEEHTNPSLSELVTTKTFGVSTNQTIDENSDLYIIVEDLGTEEKFYSNTVKILNSVQLEGATTDIPSYPTVAKGDTLTLGSYQYLVMNVEGNEALVVMKSNKTTYAQFCSSSNDYSTSNLKSLMDGYYTNSLTELGVAQDTIVPKDITVGAYSLMIGAPSESYVGKGQYDLGGYIMDYYITASSSTTLANQYVYALDVQNVVDYLGKDNLTPENIGDTFGFAVSNDGF